MSDDLPPITDEVPESERGDVGPAHFALVAEDGEVEEALDEA